MYLWALLGVPGRPPMQTSGDPVTLSLVGVTWACSCPCAFDAFLLSMDSLDVCVLPLLGGCFWASVGPRLVTWKPPASPGVCAGVVSEVRVSLKPAAAASWTLYPES